MDDEGKDNEADQERTRRRGFSDAMRWYSQHAAELRGAYESVDAADVHQWLVPLLPKPPSLILDVGAGTGRDSAWLASLGHRVIAVEPSKELRDVARALHPSPSIQWLDDRLPSLDTVYHLGLSFDLILLSGVWMHVEASDRGRAFRKLVNLLKPGGAIAFTLRQGPIEPGRGMYAVEQAEIELLAHQHGAFVQTVSSAPDRLGRDAFNWRQLLVRLPDDGTGALPFLRHIILNDEKSSTYKLALLRVICRIADGTPGYAREQPSGHVALPLGLVGLYWLRVFLPLLVADLPQSPTNHGLDGLGFVRQGFRRLTDLAAQDLRIGVQFERDRSAALHAAIADACRTITNMPAHFTTFANGGAVFPVRRRSRPPRPATIQLGEPYLASFGEFLVPQHLWYALQRYDAWIEPALIFEWARLMREYARKQGQTIDEAKLIAAMTWSDPSRDVQTAKATALRVLDQIDLCCVWSGRRLSARNLDIDHCVPWSAWPCGDLWNLMPADRIVNQRQKKDRLPSRELLRTAQERIVSWWEAAYAKGGDERLHNRFVIEARATLPVTLGSEPMRDIFAGLEILHARLLRDQQLPMWGRSK